MDRPIALDPATLHHLAHLARLRLDPEEAARLHVELETFLAHTRRILASASLDEEAGAEPLPPSPLRADEARPSLAVEHVLASAADHVAGCFVVPRPVG